MRTQRFRMVLLLVGMVIALVAGTPALAASDKRLPEVPVVGIRLGSSSLEPLRPWPNRLRQGLSQFCVELPQVPLERCDALWRAALALRPVNPAACFRNSTVVASREEHGWSILFLAQPARLGAHWLVIVPDRGDVSVSAGL